MWYVLTTRDSLNLLWFCHICREELVSITPQHNEEEPWMYNGSRRKQSVLMLSKLVPAHAHDRTTAATDNYVTHSKYRQARTHTDRQLDRRCTAYLSEPDDRWPGHTEQPGTVEDEQTHQQQAAVIPHALCCLFLSCSCSSDTHLQATCQSNLSRRLSLQSLGHDNDSRGWSDYSSSEGKHGRCGVSSPGRSWS